MKVDIQGEGNQFTVRDSATGELMDVKHLSLGMTREGLCEAILYVGVGKLTLGSVPRAGDGVREEGKAYERH